MSKVSDCVREEQSEFPEIIPFDAAGAFDDSANAVPDGESNGGDGDGPDDRPPTGPAAGLPCRMQAGVVAARPAYSLCAVVIEPDHDYPEHTDDLDYYSDGQELTGFDSEKGARAMCSAYALAPHVLPEHFTGFAIPKATHLVVNDRHGREVCRRPILRAA